MDDDNIRNNAVVHTSSSHIEIDDSSQFGGAEYASRSVDSFSDQIHEEINNVRKELADLKTGLSKLKSEGVRRADFVAFVSSSEDAHSRFTKSLVDISGSVHSLRSQIDEVDKNASERRRKIQSKVDQADESIRRLKMDVDGKISFVEKSITTTADEYHNKSVHLIEQLRTSVLNDAKDIQRQVEADLRVYRDDAKKDLVRRAGEMKKDMESMKASLRNDALSVEKKINELVNAIKMQNKVGSAEDKVLESNLRQFVSESVVVSERRSNEAMKEFRKELRTSRHFTIGLIVTVVLALLAQLVSLFNGGG